GACARKPETLGKCNTNGILAHPYMRVYWEALSALPVA
ncbi:MAG: hypothetical protein ACI89E_000477, partial [Planctomycetota bacterium]